MIEKTKTQQHQTPLQDLHNVNPANLKSANTNLLKWLHTKWENPE